MLQKLFQYTDTKYTSLFSQNVGLILLLTSLYTSLNSYLTPSYSISPQQITSTRCKYLGRKLSIGLFALIYFVYFQKRTAESQVRFFSNFKRLQKKFRQYGKPFFFPFFFFPQ